MSINFCDIYIIFRVKIIYNQLKNLEVNTHVTKMLNQIKRATDKYLGIVIIYISVGGGGGFCLYKII